MIVFGIDYENIEYGFRMDWPVDPEHGMRFDKTKVLMDPYAKVIGGRDVWAVKPDWDNMYQHRARPIMDDFDWEDDHPPEMLIEDLIIYEMHVRSFTRHPSSGVKQAGDVRRNYRQGSLSQVARRELRRTDARLRVRRVREQQGASHDGRNAL